MWTALLVIAIASMVFVFVARALLMGRRQEREPQPVTFDPDDADRFPDPGEPAPLRPDGTPVPGSRTDRAAKRPDER